MRGEEKKGVRGRAACQLSPVEFPNRRLFSAALLCHTLSVETVYICACVSIGSCLKCRQEVGEVPVDGQSNTSRPPQVQEGFCKGGEGLVVLKEGEKVVVAVGGKVGGVQV